MTDALLLPVVLPSDPRIVGMAMALRNACVTHERFTIDEAVDIVVGRMVRYLAYAHTHIGDDDILCAGKDQIDHELRAPGFAELIHPDWLQVLDPNRVKIPKFHELFGALARQRALTAQRVGRHRTRAKLARTPLQRFGNVAGVTGALHSVTPKPLRAARSARSARASLSDRSRSKKQRETGEPLSRDFQLTDTRRQLIESHGLDPQRTFATFTSHWWSAGSCFADWDAKLNYWCLKERPPPADLAERKRRRASEASWTQVRAYAESISCPLEPHAKGGETLETAEMFRSRVRDWEVRQPRVDARADEAGQLKLGKGRL